MKKHFKVVFVFLFVSYLTFAPFYFLTLGFITSSHLLNFSISEAYADVPNEITYTGRLREYNQPVTGTRTMNFRIYDAATNGTNVWSDDGESVSVKSGVFTYKLQPTNVDWRKKDYWIETTISGKILSPREKLTSQVYAFHSRTAEDIEKTAGQNIHFSIGTSTYASISSNGLSLGGSNTIQENNNQIVVSTKVYAQEFESPYGFFHYRGDASSYDFTQGTIDLTGGINHDLDLSAIVPVGAKAVCLNVCIQQATQGQNIYFQRKGDVNGINITRVLAQVANASIAQDVIVACDTNRIIQYQTNTSTGWTSVTIIVRGWWK